MPFAPDHPSAAGYSHEEGVWECLARQVASNRLVIDRSIGSAHPRYPDQVFSLDFGYLNGTQAMDGSGVHSWLGTLMPPYS